jgi:AAA+ ATPase superfamily predicted ATPase
MIDREVETAELRALLERQEPMLALLFGRRRVGKTFLLNHVWPDAQTFYYVASEATAELNRKDLLRELGRWSGRDLAPEDYPTWRTIFRFLLELNAPEPMVVVLDEYQYLRGGEEGIDSQLAAIWEEYKNRGRKRANLVLVLCGSIVEIMERLDSARSPLHGRIDWKHRLQPFDYWNAARMVPYADPMDRARVYGIFGGTPRYLASVDSAKALGENAAAAMLAPRGDVRTQVETVIEQEKGLRNIAEYKSVLAAVGNGFTERNQIAMETGLKADAGLRNMIDMLVRLGYIEGRRNFEARNNEPHRYQVADPAVAFYYKFVSRFRNELETSPPEEVWAQHVEPKLPAYMGHVFERIAEQAFYRLRGALKLPMVKEWGRWEGTDRDRKPVEIDIVARLTDGRVMTGSVKCRGRVCAPIVHRQHLDDLRRLASSGRQWAHEALEPSAPLLYVSASGFTPDFRLRAEEDGHPVIMWDMDDLYRE